MLRGKLLTSVDLLDRSLQFRLQRIGQLVDGKVELCLLSDKFLLAVPSCGAAVTVGVPGLQLGQGLLLRLEELALLVDGGSTGFERGDRCFKVAVREWPSSRAVAGTILGAVRVGGMAVEELVRWRCMWFR